MEGMALQAASSNDMPLLVVVLAFMLVTSVLSGIWSAFGWRSKAEREARLAKSLQDISRDGDMDGDVRLLKASISRRVQNAYGGGFRASLKRVALIRLGHFVAVMAFLLLAGVFNNVLAGRYYASPEDWHTLAMLALFCLGFEVIMGVVYLVLERWYPNA